MKDQTFSNHSNLCQNKHLLLQPNIFIVGWYTIITVKVVMIVTQTLLLWVAISISAVTMDDLCTMKIMKMLAVNLRMDLKMNTVKLHVYENTVYINQ